jgi:hypothetical protein
MVHQCEKCKKNFMTSQGLKRHKERKFSCVPDDDKNKKFQCKYCTSVFSFRQSKSIHEKRNCKNRLIEVPDQMNSFGKESHNHLQYHFLTECLTSGNKGITNLMKELHFNDNEELNHNIRVYSVKKKILEKYIDGQWIVCDQSSTIDEMIRKGYRILFQHLCKINDEYMQNSSDRSDEYDEAIRRNENANQYLTNLIKKNNIYYELRRMIFTMILAQHHTPAVIAKLGL